MRQLFVKTNDVAPTMSVSSYLSSLTCQYNEIVTWKAATLVELHQQLLLINYNSMPIRAGHRQGTRSHRKVLAEWLGMTIYIENTEWRNISTCSEVEIFAAKIKERYFILQGRLNVGDKCQDMGNRYFI